MRFIKRPTMKPKHLGQSDLYNPPAYYQSMATDLTQVPTQVYPYGSGSGTPSQYGPWYGYMFGQRTFEKQDADRMAREQAENLVRRSETSTDPKDKYITPEGRLNPGVAAALQRAKQAQKIQQIADPIAAMQKKVLITVLLGSVLAALLR